MDLHQPVNLENRTLDELTDEEKLRYQHQKMHEQHKGHETMHAEMLLVLIVTLLVAQFVLIEWRKRHYRSYSLVTLLGMWLVPLVLCLRNFWWRFIFTWLLFTCISGLIARKALQKPIDRTTPSLVFALFLTSTICENQVVYFDRPQVHWQILGGYFVLMATFFGINVLFNAKPNMWMECGTLFIFYGLYYGVLGRDVSEICADKMAAHIGYYTDQGMPTRHLDPNVCAVCGNKLLVGPKEEGIIENTYKLTCEHEFHEFCIRGWCIVGKKQICPYCREKVDLKRMFSNPWEKPHVLFGQLLDWIRWLVAWQPMIIFLVQGINWILGLE